MAARYRLRFFLDAGSGICLWSQDDQSKSRYGYAVELDELPLPADLVAELMHLMADYDATIDWDNPGGAARPAPDELDPGHIAFGYEDDAPFRERIRALLPRIRAALGADIAVESDYDP